MTDEALAVVGRRRGEKNGTAISPGLRSDEVLAARLSFMLTLLIR